MVHQTSQWQSAEKAREAANRVLTIAAAAAAAAAQAAKLVAPTLGSQRGEYTCISRIGLNSSLSLPN